MDISKDNMSLRNCLLPKRDPLMISVELDSIEMNLNLEGESLKVLLVSFTLIFVNDGMKYDVFPWEWEGEN